MLSFVKLTPKSWRGTECIEDISIIFEACPQAAKRFDRAKNEGGNAKRLAIINGYLS